MVKKYRKKPVVIEAVLFVLLNGNEIAKWCGGTFKESCGTNCIKIPTLEGVMTATSGDFIIKGVKGEFYPCKPEIFKETYVEVLR